MVALDGAASPSDGCARADWVVDAMSDSLRCYAQIASLCFHGHPLEDWRDDGTYDQLVDGIVCDGCYIEVMNASPSGRALAHEIRPTISRVRAARRQEAA